MKLEITKVIADVSQKIMEATIEKREDECVNVHLGRSETIWINTPKGMVRVAVYGETLSMGIYADPQTIDLFKSKGVKFSTKL